MAVELSVGEVAARSGVAVSALHFYERRGLIRSHRTGGNQRRYGRDVLRRLGIIKVAQRVGIPLAEIQTAFETGYSRLWYLEAAPAPAFEGSRDATRPWAGGFGNGGQRLWVSPSTGIAAVAYLGMYNDWSSWIMPTRFWREMVMLNFERE